MLRDKLENTAKELKKNARSWILLLGVILSSVAFVIINLLVWNKTSSSLVFIATNGVLHFVSNILIKALLGEKGLADGKANIKYADPKDKYVLKAELADPFSEKVDDFYEKIKLEKKTKIRKTTMQRFRMHYETFFDEKGNYIEHEIMPKRKYKKELNKDKNYKVEDGVVVLDKTQRKVLDKMIKLETFAPDLFTEYSNDLNVYTNRDKTEADVRVEKNGLNIFFGLLISFITAYFTFVIVFDPGKILSSLFALLSFIAFGTLQYYQNFTFITIDMVEQLDRKNKLLTRFLLENMSQEEYKKKLKEIFSNTEEKVAQESEKEQNKEQQVEYVEMTQEEFEKMKGTK